MPSKQEEYSVSTFFSEDPIRYMYITSGRQEMCLFTSTSNSNNYYCIYYKKNMTMVILTMASVQEQGENEQKNKSLMLYIAPAHQDRLHDSTLLKPVLL